jgi:hypothetical protein
MAATPVRDIVDGKSAKLVGVVRPTAGARVAVFGRCRREADPEKPSYRDPQDRIVLERSQGQPLLLSEVADDLFLRRQLAIG